MQDVSRIVRSTRAGNLKGQDPTLPIIGFNVHTTFPMRPLPVPFLSPPFAIKVGNDFGHLT